MTPIHGAPTLKSVVDDVIIIKHNEDTTQLEQSLTAEGFNISCQKAVYSQQEQSYATNIRCLINHSQAWKKAAENEKFTIVVEADFVPVIGFANLPLPFIPSKQNASMAWLYSVGPVIYGVEPSTNAIWGHNAGTVAYVLDKPSAQALVELYDADMAEPDPGAYRNWEVYLPIKLRREKSVRCYIPHRMYGEHGGIANKEHNKYGYVGWHEADRLAGPLHFLPTYAKGSYAKYCLRRARGWSRGLYRYALGKFFDGWHFGWYKSGEHRALKAYLALRRLI